MSESITESDRDELEQAAYKMQEAYNNVKTSRLYDAIAEVHKHFPKISLWQLEGMWRSIDAYVDING